MRIRNNSIKYDSVLEYYLNDNETDVQDFSMSDKKKRKTLSFKIIPNPTTILDVEGSPIECKIVLDRELAIYYVKLGKYKSVISDYDWKNLKNSFYSRWFEYENNQKTDKTTDDLITGLVKAEEERRKKNEISSDEMAMPAGRVEFAEDVAEVGMDRPVMEAVETIAETANEVIHNEQIADAMSNTEEL